jgi:hypothetical protein
MIALGLLGRGVGNVSTGLALVLVAVGVGLVVVATQLDRK